MSPGSGLRREFISRFDYRYLTVLTTAIALSGLSLTCCEGKKADLSPTSLAAPYPDAGVVIKKDPSFDEIVGTGSRVEKLATGFIFIEGPVWAHQPEPQLLFTEVRRNGIYKWNARNGVGVYLKPAFDGPTGPTCLTLDRQARVVMCEHGNRRITRIEKDGRKTVLADRYKGKRLNSPNDAVYRSDGWLYFTDPPYGLKDEDADPRKELDFDGVFRLGPDGELELLSTALKRPNGIAFSPDENVLYVSNSDPHSKVVMAYSVLPDGRLGPPRVFHDFTSEPEDGSLDGLAVDVRGNVYVTGLGGVWVLSAGGKHLGTIRPDERPSNLAWGDDGSTLYITAQTSVYRIALRVRGLRP